jgi:diketogulonate reductase-like aldo/keto reductase
MEADGGATEERACTIDRPLCVSGLFLTSSKCLARSHKYRFGHDELKAILADCIITPAVNMIMFNPVVLPEMLSVVELMTAHDIVVGGYSALKPLWAGTNSALLEVVRSMAELKQAKEEQILLSWARNRGHVLLSDLSWH